MTLPIYIVDSFTSRAFAGNPTAVCIAAEALEYDKMLNIIKTGYVISIFSPEMAALILISSIVWK